MFPKMIFKAYLLELGAKSPALCLTQAHTDHCISPISLRSTAVNCLKPAGRIIITINSYFNRLAPHSLIHKSLLIDASSGLLPDTYHDIKDVSGPANAHEARAIVQPSHLNVAEAVHSDSILRS